MRSPWTMVAAMAALALTGYATWLALDRPSSPGRPAAQQPSSPPPPAEIEPSATSRSQPTSDAPASPAPADKPRPKLGDSQDPGRASQATEIYEQALTELRALRGPDPERAAALFLEAKAAIERMEDELPRDDPAARAELDRKLEALRDALRRASEG